MGPNAIKGPNAAGLCCAATSTDLPVSVNWLRAKVKTFDSDIGEVKVLRFATVVVVGGKASYLRGRMAG